MALVKVTFVNFTTNASMVNTEVDDDMTVREVVSHLIAEKFVPALPSDQNYVLQIKGKTELSSENATLRSGNVANNDTIVVVAAQRGGASCNG